jgi:hypothetical protein
MEEGEGDEKRRSLAGRLDRKEKRPGVRALCFSVVCD